MKAVAVRHRLSRPQWKIWKRIRTKRFVINVCGRRFGKTHLACLKLIEEAVNNPGSISWYIAPTYRQAEQIAWQKLKDLLPRSYIAAKNETDLRIEFVNGSILALRGADNPDSLRGVGLDFVVLDECAFMDKSVWTEVIRPALADRMGRALFISTPSGFNWIYDLYIDAAGREDWARFTFTTAEGGNVPLAEIEAAKAELDDRTFRQEYEASFENLTGRVYYKFDRDKNVRIDVVDNESLPLLVGMDFNIDPMSATLAVLNGGQVHFFDEVSIPNGNTEMLAQELRRRYPKRRIMVYPDPTGNARKTSAAVGQTDFTILRSHGFTVLAPTHPYPVADKINTFNAALCNAAGDRRVFISPRCRQLIKGLDGLTFKEGTNAPDKSLGLDHMTDAAAYLVLYELPMRGRTQTAKLEAS